MLVKSLTCWLSWYDGGGTLWVAIIVTAGAGDTCCIMGLLHIKTRGKQRRKKEGETKKSDCTFYYGSRHQVLLK